MAELTVEGFRPHVGTTFVVTAADASLSLIDLQVRLGPERMRTPFTLTFSSPSQFGQGTYELDHPAMGRFDLFLVPERPLADGVPRYVAVFN